MREQKPADSNFENRVRESFSKQKVMTTLGAEMTSVKPGLVEISLPFRDDLTQQHGYLHAGVVVTILDSASGYAAFTLFPPSVGILAVEFKANFLSPAVGDSIVARGTVIKHGRTLSVCQGEAYAVQDGTEKLVATLTSTVMAIRDRGLID